MKTLQEDYASQAWERKDLLPRDADHGHRTLGRVLQTRLRLEHPEARDGSTSFDDTVGEVSGTWVTRRLPAARPGLLFCVMVDSVAATLDVIAASEGECVQPIGGDAPEITARFRDPAGNVIGLFQQS